MGDVSLHSGGHPYRLVPVVPEGRNDGSGSTELAEVQAIHCLEHARKKIRPGGYGVTGVWTVGLFSGAEGS